MWYQQINVIGYTQSYDTFRSVLIKRAHDCSFTPNTYLMKLIISKTSHPACASISDMQITYREAASASSRKISVIGKQLISVRALSRRMHLILTSMSYFICQCQRPDTSSVFPLQTWLSLTALFLVVGLHQMRSWNCWEVGSWDNNVQIPIWP